MMKRLSFLLLFGISIAVLVGALLSASVPADDWKIAGPFGGTATTVAVNPKNTSTVLAGGMSSLLFRSDNAGESWQVLDFPQRTLSEVTSILIDPADTDHYLVGMIAADSAGLFESNNSGKTWKPVKDVYGFGVRALAVAPSDPSRFVAGTQHGVMLSNNSGKSWTRISDPQNLEMQGITAVAIDPVNPDMIYAGTTHLPWRTTDGGKTWESIHTGMIDDSDVFSIYVDPRSPSNVFASACSGIYSSSDRGDLWHKLMGIPNTSRRTHVIRFEPGNCCGDPGLPGAVYAGTTMGLFRSLNNGTTWKALTGTQVNSLAFVPSEPNNVYLALEYEGVGRSQNGGENIDLVNNGFVDRVISSVTVSGSKFVSIETQDGESSGIFVSNDKGSSWTQIHNAKGVAGVHLSAIVGSRSEDRILLAASSHEIYKSIDAGLSWKAVPVKLLIPPPPEAEKPAPKTVRGKMNTRARTVKTVKPKPMLREIYPSEISALYVSKRGTKDLIYAATDLGLLKTEDMGEQWTLDVMPGSAAVTALYLRRNFDGSMIARASAGLYLTKDYGDHWTPISFPLPASDVNDVAIPLGSDCPLLVATRTGLYSSSDDGATWSANQGGIPASTVTSVLYKGDTSTGYAIEYGRLFQTSNAGKSWKEVPTALRSTRIRQLWTPDANSDRLYGITSDLGIIFRN